MDFGVFQEDLKKALRKLPPELVNIIGNTLVGLVKTYHESLGEVFPALIEDLKPHLGAIAMEQAMGYLDTDGLEKSVMNVLADLGIKVG